MKIKKLIVNQTLEAYDAIAPLYADYSEKKKQYLDAVDELVISEISVSDRLLDIGAGDGRRLAKIKNTLNLLDSIAIEPSQAMAELCNKTANVQVFNTLAEDLDQIEIGKFNVITALWNVFGHISDSSSRLKALKNISQKLHNNGLLILDVNNRHNAISYGKKMVFFRVIIDHINFKESRGDASYDWHIDNQTFKSKGHLFTSSEIESLFTKAGFTVTKRLSINYLTGEISGSKYRGQLFYVLKKTKPPLYK